MGFARRRRSKLPVLRVASNRVTFVGIFVTIASTGLLSGGSGEAEEDHQGAR
jgi:hypothetical protein